MVWRWCIKESFCWSSKFLMVGIVAYLLTMWNIKKVLICFPSWYNKLNLVQSSTFCVQFSMEGFRNWMLDSTWWCLQWIPNIRPFILWPNSSKNAHWPTILKISCDIGEIEFGAQTHKTELTLYVHNNAIVNLSWVKTTPQKQFKAPMLTISLAKKCFSFHT